MGGILSPARRINTTLPVFVLTPPFAWLVQVTSSPSCIAFPFRFWRREPAFRALEPEELEALAGFEALRHVWRRRTVIQDHAIGRPCLKCPVDVGLPEIIPPPPCGRSRRPGGQVSGSCMYRFIGVDESDHCVRFHVPTGLLFEFRQ